MASLIHYTAHGLTAGTAFKFANLDPFDCGVDDTTVYYVLAAGLTADDFEFSDSDGGAAITLTADITSVSIVAADGYDVVADGVMDPPTAVPTPSLPTLTSAVVSGIVRLRVSLNDTAEAKVRLWEVHFTHKFIDADADWTTPQIVPLPENSTDVSIPALPSTLYAVRVRAQDVYGQFGAFCADSTVTTADGNDSLSAALADLANDVPDGSIDTTKIADGAISTPKLQAGSVTAQVLAATIVLASLIKTAASGRRLEFDVDGIRIYDTDDSLLVRLPTNGDPNYFKGQVDANSLISESTAEFRGVASLAGSAVMTLTNGVAAPSAAPGVVASVDSTALVNTPADADISAGIGYDSGNNSFWIAADPTATGGYVAHEFNATTGLYSRSIMATGSVTTVHATLGNSSHISDSASGFDGTTNSHFTTPLTIPAGLTNVWADSVAVYIAGHNGSAVCRVGIWSTGNSALKESADFTASSGGPTTLGASAHYSKLLTSPLAVTAGTTYRVGFRHLNGSEGIQFDRDDGSGKTTYSGDGTTASGSGWGTLYSSSKPNVAMNYHYDVDTRLETAVNIAVCTDGTYVYTLDDTGVIWKYDRTTLAYVANSGVQTAITGAKESAGMFYDATANELIITTFTGTGAGVFPKFVRVSPSTLAVSSSVYSAAAGTTFNGTSDWARGGARVNDPLNASAATYWVPFTGTVYAYTFSGTTATQTANRDFGTTTTCRDGLTYDGTNFRGYSVLTPTTMWTFSNWDWTTASAIYWLCYAWYDSNATGGTHETAVGPRTSKTLRRRERIQVSSATIPVGGTDDPDKVRVYMKPNATDPGAGNFKLQVTDALTARYLTDYNSAGAADGGGTAFPSGTPAELKSAATGWDFKGDGTGTLGLNVTGGKPPVVNVYTTTGANTWTKPAGLAFIVVECVGGGGSGGGVAGNATAGHCAFGGSGGAGGYARKVFTAAQLTQSSYTATVGAGGAKPTAGANNGNSGANSTFAGTGITTVQGSAGTFGASGGDVSAFPTTLSQQAAGGAASGGDINIPGGNSLAGVALSISRLQPTTPGHSHLGTFQPQAVQTASGSADGADGTAYGNGGCGAWTVATGTNRAGGKGADGVIIVTEYYLG